MNRINNTSRQELTKFRKFLNKNPYWICQHDDCGQFNKVCYKCRFIDILKYSYKSNPQGAIMTFANSYLSNQFDELYFDYYKKYGQEGEKNCLFL